MDAELLPCPFCGGCTQFHSDDSCDGCHYIHCSGCGIMAEVVAYRSEPGQKNEPLMTVALHNRIVAAISMQQAGTVSVPVELAKRLANPDEWLANIRKAQEELRTLLSNTTQQKEG